jgi:hypothetical protein
MKKTLIFLAVTLFCLSLTGCLPKKEELTTTGKPEDYQMTEPGLSEDDSVEIIEEELNDTELEDFEAELDALDEEINQL